MINLNSKKLTKIVSALMIVLMVLAIVSPVFAAADTSWATGTTDGSGAGSFKKIMNQIIGYVQLLGIGIAVVMLLVLAIKYITAAPSDKADIKKSAVVYVVGAVILFGASGLLEIIRGIGETFNK